ncbi:zinc-ribbon domain-containing protein [Mesobacillus foraminis]|uniref:zinc-ribbon domain-containing protein n=1 Tax=Mesobacillus foraminis TaxID=279826 RepID=UPI0027D7BC92|nr:zinc-ribbon domain-containing protein [Mesobacillus foraminis]
MMEEKGCDFMPKRKKTLLEFNAELSQQWHPDKNGSLTPSDVTPGSGKKVWWVCKKAHEWEASIHHADKSYPGDNRLISPKSPHRRGGLAPRLQR